MSNFTVKFTDHYASLVQSNSGGGICGEHTIASVSLSDNWKVPATDESITKFFAEVVHENSDLDASAAVALVTELMDAA